MIDTILQSTFWALLLTSATYHLGLFLFTKTGSAIFHPILVSAGLIIPFLLLTGISNESYQTSMKSVSWLLTPCTVSFGLILYTQVQKLKAHIWPILAGVVTGTAVSLLSVWGLCLLFKLDHTLLVSLLPKSVTTAMAQPLSESSGGIVSLTTGAVVFTAILGGIFGPIMCKLFFLKDPISQGVAFGTASHVVGTTKATEINELSGAVGSLSLVITGLLTAIALSFIL